MIHGIISACFCLLFIAIGLPWPCLFWPTAFYIGREVAQAEERWLKANNLKRSLAPWWCGFKPEAWNAKGILDWLLPLFVSLAALLGQSVLW